MVIKKIIMIHRVYLLKYAIIWDFAFIMSVKQNYHCSVLAVLAITIISWESALLRRNYEKYKIENLNIDINIMNYGM